MPKNKLTVTFVGILCDIMTTPDKDRQSQQSSERSVILAFHSDVAIQWLGAVSLANFQGDGTLCYVQQCGTVTGR